MIKSVKDILRASQFGIQGALDQTMAEVYGSALKGAFGFVTGAFKGVAGIDSALHNATGIGKITGGLGYGIGRAVSLPIRPVGKFAFVAGAHIVKTLPHDTKEAFKLTRRLFNAATTDNVENYADLGLGFLGRRIKKPVGWGISAATVGFGMAGAYADFDYNFGLRTTVNGIMDTQGVATTPGGINQTYIPINRNKQINNHGADANLVFAMHHKRNG